MVQVDAGTADVPILVEDSAENKTDFLKEVPEMDAVILEESQKESPDPGNAISPIDDSMLYFFFSLLALSKYYNTMQSR